MPDESLFDIAALDFKTFSLEHIAAEPTLPPSAPIRDSLRS